MSGSMFMAWLVIVVALAGEYAERVNAAAELLEAGVPAAEAARVLAGRFGCSARQARRYVEQAARSGRRRCRRRRGVHRQAARGAGRAGAGACARESGRTISAVVAQALDGVLGAGPQRTSPQVNDRAVETEFVFGRHAATELSVAYAILVPQRRARIVRPGQEGRPQHDAARRSTPGSPAPGRRRTRRSGRRPRRCASTPSRPRLDVPEEWVFEDEGHSGATLVRPALEALRDLAAQGCLDVVLCYSPDRLARKFAYQALLIEEFARAGVRVEFVKGPRGDSPEDQLLVQFQGMFAEYEKAQLMERYRRGKAHRAQHRLGERAVRRPVRLPVRPQDPDMPAPRYEIVEHEAALVARDVPPLRRRRRRHRRPGPLADRPGRAHPDRQAPLGPRRDLGHAAQPRLRRPRGVRQDHGHPASRPG